VDDGGAEQVQWKSAAMRRGDEDAEEAARNGPGVPLRPAGTVADVGR